MGRTGRLAVAKLREAVRAPCKSVMPAMQQWSRSRTWLQGSPVGCRDPYLVGSLRRLCWCALTGLVSKTDALRVVFRLRRV